MNITRLWRSLAYNLSEGGLRQVIVKACSRVDAWIATEEPWLIYRTVLSTDFVPDPSPLQHRLLGFSDLVRHRYFKALSFPEMIKARLDNNVECHGFFVDDELVHLVWAEPGVLRVCDGLALEASGGVGFLDGITFPQHRRKGYQGARAQILHHHLAHRGFTHILTAISPHHSISIKGNEKGGAVLAGRAIRRVRMGRTTVHLEGDGLVLYRR